MGFFKKLVKGISKPFKSIGKAIKKVAVQVGKVADKFGIVGQIGLAFILPGIGGMIAKGLGTVLSGVAGWAAQTGGIIGNIIGGAAKFASAVGRTFQTVTAGIKNYVGEFAKTAASKLGFNIEGAATNFFGEGGAFDIAGKNTMEVWDTSTWGKAVEKITTDPAMTGIKPEVTTTAVTPVTIEGEVVADPFARIPKGIPTVEAMQPAPSLLSPEAASTFAMAPALDIPDYTLTETAKPGIIQRATQEVKDFGTSLIQQPISSAIKGYQLYQQYASEEPQYDMLGQGRVMDVGQGQQFQASSIDFINSTASPYGYNAYMMDTNYRGGTWKNRMGGLA